LDGVVGMRSRASGNTCPGETGSAMSKMSGEIRRRRKYRAEGTETTEVADIDYPQFGFVRDLTTAFADRFQPAAPFGLTLGVSVSAVCGVLVPFVESSKFAINEGSNRSLAPARIVTAINA
jgi:hypothetical protein